MKLFTIILVLVLLPLALLLVHGYLSGDDAAPPPAAEAKPQTLCPVMNMPIDKQFFADHNGKRIYFCHQGCVDAFKADPDKYMKILSDSGVTLESTPAVPSWQNLESDDGATRMKAAIDLYTMRTDVQTYLLQAAQRTCVKPDAIYLGPSQCVIGTLGEWRLKEAVPILMNIVDLFIDIPNMDILAFSEIHFPAAHALVKIGAARETLDAFLARLKTGDMDERSLKLAVWCLQEILTKDYATALLKYAADKEQDPAVKARIKAAADLSDTQKDFPRIDNVSSPPLDAPPAASDSGKP